MVYEIFIHVGPPKTGTSSIQNWLCRNHQSLLLQGVYYPPHNVDSNGVSSGNLASICDVVPPSGSQRKTKISVNEEKVQNLIDDFERSGCRVLLISSEFFLWTMPRIKELIPEAKFIAYLRNPLETLESDYNQGVKRSGFTHKISLPEGNSFSHWSALREYKKIYGLDGLILRYYDTHLNQSGNIVADFLSLLGVDGDVSDTLINPKYCFEALEFKRWLNHFNLNGFEIKIDRLLQKYSSGVYNYSLVGKSEYSLIAKNYSALAEKMCDDFCVEKKSEFVGAILKPSSKPFFKQELKKGQFEDVFHYLGRSLSKEEFISFIEIISLSSFQVSKKYDGWFEACKKVYFRGMPFFDWLMLLPRYFQRWLTQDRNGSRRRRAIRMEALHQFRMSLKIDERFEEADVLRELAILMKRHDFHDGALFFIEQASYLRPNGKLIGTLLKEYQEYHQKNRASAEPTAP